MDQLPSFFRRPGESARAYDAFTAFRDLGPRRTIAAAYWAYKGLPKGAEGVQKGRRIPGHFIRMARKNNWRDRADDFDYDTERRREIASEDLRRQDAALQAERLHAARTAYQSFTAKLMAELERAIPAMLQPGCEIVEGKPIAVKPPPLVHLPRLMKELRTLESALQHGFPPPGTQW